MLQICFQIPGHNADYDGDITPYFLGLFLYNVDFATHVASPAGDRPSVYRIAASITPPRWQYVYQTTSS